jgi:hypothetical protein
VGDEDRPEKPTLTALSGLTSGNVPLSEEVTSSAAVSTCLTVSGCDHRWCVLSAHCDRAAVLDDCHVVWSGGDDQSWRVNAGSWAAQCADAKPFRLLVLLAFLTACLGGNGTIIGASANVVIIDLARKAGYRITFWQFCQYGFPVMIGSVALSALYLWGVVLGWFIHQLCWIMISPVDLMIPVSFL